MTTKSKRTHQPVSAAPPAAAPTPTVERSASADLEDMVNRAYNRPLTQEEGAFLASLRGRIDAGQGISEFDRGWLTALADR